MLFTSRVAPGSREPTGSSGPQARPWASGSSFGDWSSDRVALRRAVCAPELMRSRVARRDLAVTLNVQRLGPLQQGNRTIAANNS